MLPSVIEVLSEVQGRTRRCARSRKAIAALGVGLALLVSPRAGANIRAPRTIPESPSSAFAAAGGTLTVLRERLRFDCGAEACRVSAEYDVTATEATRARLEFVLPVASPVTATTNGAAGAVQVVPTRPSGPGWENLTADAGTGAAPLFSAAFESAFRAGSNTVSVRYSQPLGGEETGYTYGKAGRMVRRFRYELWPLREWTRSPAFRLELAVAIERPAPSWWARRFGNPRSVNCLATNPGTALAGRREQRGGQLWYEAEVGPTIPDRITCYIGDEDLMPRY